jgi:hypothetical protein
MSNNQKRHYSTREFSADIKTLHRRVQEKLRHDKEKLIRKRYKDMPKYDRGENDGF